MNKTYQELCDEITLLREENAELREGKASVSNGQDVHLSKKPRGSGMAFGEFKSYRKVEGNVTAFKHFASAQSGKTTRAAGLVRFWLERGIKGALAVPIKPWFYRHAFKFSEEYCIGGLDRLLQQADQLNALVIDNPERFPNAEGDVVELMLARLHSSEQARVVHGFYRSEPGQLVELTEGWEPVEYPLASVPRFEWPHEKKPIHELSIDRLVTAHALEGDTGDMNLMVFARGEYSAGGAQNHYQIVEKHPEGCQWLVGEVNFQDGNPAIRGVNGVTLEAVLACCLDRLECFQRGPFANNYNAAALQHIEQAMESLHDRVRERDQEVAK
ncbi:hypothetical protein GCM10010082_31560 [Kushneria pakistanensis]|uniref:Acb2/Tad1 hairpin domain-containing protein n=1 Tax=Kushneria pakistanensis TaxID=1508770 RepID=A0ABQ3FRD7_9GAMM|nr:hypothetical protein [Kushneria pakistanensis]GHC34570.1 hypothetical protein GCM10010082_31560 [Kushneria pakistanensis]